MKDYYQILDVSKNASEDEIKKAYRKLAHQHHPDKQGGDEKKFKEINEAYQVLSDKTKRSRYDQFGATFEGAGASGSSGQSGFGGFDFNDIFRGAGGFQGFSSQGGSGWEDIFSDIFGGSRAGRRVERGEDIAIDLQIDFIEAVKGVKKQINLYKRNVCEECGGTGVDKGSSFKSCHTCHGSGTISKTQRTFLGNFTQSAVCEVCYGSGQIPEKKCAACGGDGRTRTNKNIEINIPAGIRDKQTIKLEKQGEAPPRRGIHGDLYITVYVKPHPYFIRKDDDIYYEVELNFTQLILGDKIKVPTLDGEVKLKIPVSTVPGKLFRLKGLGAPHLDRRGTGDMYVRVKLKMPGSLSWEQKRIIEQLKKEGL